MVIFVQWLATCLLAGYVGIFPAFAPYGAVLMYGWFMGTLTFHVGPIYTSPLGVYLMLSLTIVAVRFWPRRRESLASAGRWWIYGVLLYATSFILPAISHYLWWGAVPRSLLVASIISFWGLAYFLMLPPSQRTYAHHKRQAWVFLGFILVLSLPQAIAFYYVSGGMGLGRLRSYGLFTKLTLQIHLIHVEPWTKWFQLNLELALAFFVALAAPLADWLSRAWPRRAREWAFIGGLLGIQWYLFIAQYYKFIVLVPLAVVVGGVVVLLWRRGRAPVAVVCIVLSVGSLLTQDTIANYVHQKLGEVSLRSQLDLDNLGRPGGKMFARDQPSNRIGLIYRSAEKWVATCFHRGSGEHDTGGAMTYNPVAPKGVISVHSSLIDRWIIHGIWMGTIANAFFFFFPLALAVCFLLRRNEEAALGQAIQLGSIVALGVMDVFMSNHIFCGIGLFLVLSSLRNLEVGERRA